MGSFKKFTIIIELVFIRVGFHQLSSKYIKGQYRSTKISFVCRAVRAPQGEDL